VDREQIARDVGAIIRATAGSADYLGNVIADYVLAHEQAARSEGRTDAIHEIMHNPQTSPDSLAAMLVQQGRDEAREPLEAQIAALKISDKALREENTVLRREQAERERSLRGQIAALREMLDAPPKYLSTVQAALDDTASAAREHDEAIKRAAFEAGARAQRERDVNWMAQARYAVARYAVARYAVAFHAEPLVSPPAQEGS
jgi:hypothetical protein